MTEEENVADIICNPHNPDDDIIFLPVLHYFAMNNIFTGSNGNFRFRAEPHVEMATPKEVDFANSNIKAEFWHGIFCYEKSEMEGEKVFPMSEEGRAELRAWLISNM